MSNNIENAVVTLINKAVQGMETATEFLVAEIPDVIQQLLMWHFAKYLILWLFFLLLIPLSIYVIFKVFKDYKVKVSWACDDYGMSPIAIVLTLLFGGLLVVSFSQIFIRIDWLMIWLAPKVWLIEYAAKLVN
jgi:hypothetical protein